MQTKRNSLIESLANTFAGLGISFAISFLIYPLLGMEGTWHSYASATLFFTVMSVGRNYFVRRGFAQLRKRGVL